MSTEGVLVNLREPVVGGWRHSSRTAEFPHTPLPMVLTARKLSFDQCAVSTLLHGCKEGWKGRAHQLQGFGHGFG